MMPTGFVFATQCCIGPSPSVRSVRPQESLRPNPEIAAHQTNPMRSSKARREIVHELGSQARRFRIEGPENQRKSQEVGLTVPDLYQSAKFYEQNQQ
jgi:hypothetical protein